MPPYWGAYGGDVAMVRLVMSRWVEGVRSMGSGPDAFSVLYPDLTSMLAGIET